MYLNGTRFLLLYEEQKRATQLKRAIRFSRRERHTLANTSG